MTIEGFHFSCTRCGACCRWTGRVYLYPHDVHRLARFRGLELQDFVDRHCDLVEVSFPVSAPGEGDTLERVPYLVLKKQPDGACVFLGRDNLCGVHAAKPYQCEATPIVADILLSPENLASFKELSPGMRTGPYHDAERIAARLGVQEMLDAEYDDLLARVHGRLDLALGGVDLPRAEPMEGMLAGPFGEAPPAAPRKRKRPAKRRRKKSGAAPAPPPPSAQ